MSTSCSLFRMAPVCLALVLAGCSPGGSSGGDPSSMDPIERKSGPVSLGMTVEQLEAVTEVTEQTGTNPGLIEGERSFELKRKAVPEGVRSVGLRFLNDRLYRITVDYIPNHYDEARWNSLMGLYRERYGKGHIQKMRMSKYPTELISWEDKDTRMVLRREIKIKFSREGGAQNQYNVMLVLLDMPVWREREKLEQGVF